MSLTSASCIVLLFLLRLFLALQIRGENGVNSGNNCQPQIEIEHTQPQNRLVSSMSKVNDFSDYFFVIGNLGIGRQSRLKSTNAQSWAPFLRGF